MRFKLPWTVCRLCLREGKMYRLFVDDETKTRDEDALSLAEKISLVCDIKIVPDKRLPMEVCSRCLIQLNAAFEFRMLCKKTDCLLQMFQRHTLKTELGRKHEALMLTLKNGKVITVPKDVTVKPTSTKLKSNQVAFKTHTTPTVTVSKLTDPLADPVTVSYNSLTKFLSPSRRVKLISDAELSVQNKNRAECKKSSGKQTSKDEDDYAESENETSEISFEMLPVSNDLTQPLESGASETNDAAELNTPKSNRPEIENVNNSQHFQETQTPDKDAFHDDADDDIQYINEEYVSEEESITPNEIPYTFVIRSIDSRHPGKKVTYLTPVRQHGSTEVTYTYKHVPDFKSIKKKVLKKSVQQRKEIICELCGNVYKSKVGFELHMRAHRNERPFKCELCDAAYTQSAKLKIHMRRHTGEKPYACKFCDRRFMKNVACKLHERMHTGEKPYTCEVCGRSFAYSCVLSRHKELHTNKGKNHFCRICGKSFRMKYHLTAHLKTNVHKEDLKAEMELDEYIIC